MYFVEHQGADLLNEALELRVMEGFGADASQLHCLQLASKHRQIIMGKADNMEPVSSLAFAKISKYTLRLIATNTEYKLRPHEYNEGKILYILDVFCKKNNLKKSISLLIPLLKKYRLIVYKKNGRLRVLSKAGNKLKFEKYLRQ